MTSRIAATSLAQPAPVSVIHSISDSLRSKQRSATEVVQHYLDSLARVEPSVGAFITVNREQAIQEVRHSNCEFNGWQFSTRGRISAPFQAANLDKRIAEQGAQALGPLAGVPVAIKVAVAALILTVLATETTSQQFASPSVKACHTQVVLFAHPCRTTSAPEACAPLLAHASCPHSCPHMMPQLWRACAVLVPSLWGRQTWMSLGWAPALRTLAIRYVKHTACVKCAAHQQILATAPNYACCTLVRYYPLALPTRHDPRVGEQTTARKCDVCMAPAVDTQPLGHGACARRLLRRISCSGGSSPVRSRPWFRYRCEHKPCF
jgi:hypothetical protein